MIAQTVPRVPATSAGSTSTVRDRGRTLALGGLDIDVDDIGLRRPTLDEVFLKLTGAPSQPADRGESERATERAGTGSGSKHEEKK